MNFNSIVSLILLLVSVALPSLEALLFPLLFPLSVKITIHSRRPTHPPPVKSYHFEAEPAYKEVKGSAYPSPHYAYGSGVKYGTSYEDGHSKVYTGEPHVSLRGKYITGHISGIPSINGHISITADPVPPSKSHISITSGTTIKTDPHYKGTPYSSTHLKISSGQPHYKGTAYDAPETHYKGTEYEAPPKTHYKGSDDSSHYKGTPYEAQPETHYKGTEYDAPPKTYYKDNDESSHHKGTPYDAPPKTHYKGSDDSDHHKGTPYEAPPKTHYKGTSYDDAPRIHIQGSVDVEPPSYYKGNEHTTKARPHVYKKHNYIKSVGGYKLTDYINDDKAPNYDDIDVDDESAYIAIPPSKSFAEMEAAHKAANAHKLGGGPKAYAAEEYADLGTHKYRKEYEHGLLDDTLPEYKRTVPKPAYGMRRKVPDFRYEASSTKYSKVAPAPKETKIYAGFGTSVYGDSYAKMVYVPKSLRVTVRRYNRM